MARRRRKNVIDGAYLIGVLFCLLVIWLLVKVAAFLVVLGVVALAAVVFFFGLNFTVHVRNRRTLSEKATAAINRNADQLARRRAQLVRADAYGKPILDKWVEEVNYFINQHVEPTLTVGEGTLLEQERATITQGILQQVEQVTRSRPAFEAFSEKLTPTEFEAFCADKLRQLGWQAYVTRQSRDQGVDVIAEKNGVRIVLQCKLYSNPVGNKAVQEAVAARAFEQAHYSAVVSNSSYTSAAEQLASTNQVLLLHYSELQNIENLCNSKTYSPATSLAVMPSQSCSRCGRPVTPDGHFCSGCGQPL